MSLAQLCFDLPSLHRVYTSGEAKPADVITEVLRRIAVHDDRAIWIHRLSAAELAGHVERITSRAIEDQPLYGVPFAIKDNIDLAGTPTTAACPEFTYTPTESAFVVRQLLEAGAIPIGKTNLDQFATGLVGTRSPYGTPRNPFHPEIIPGGSSSGSAVATAAGMVSFALGTDTAGSGRVPASLNNLVGLKPTRGWFSTSGIVPACRSLDCPSIFALTVADASAVAKVMGAYDPTDAFARPAPSTPRAKQASSTFRFGVPATGQLDWFGDSANPPLFEAATEHLKSLGGEPIQIDFTPFSTAARLLYEGPWIAERWSAIRGFHATHAEALHPITRRIIEGGATPLAVDAFEASYRLAELRREAERTWNEVDVMVTPTAGTVYTRDEVAADPVALNSNLGAYTNFANLLDTAALAVPIGLRPDKVPFGVTLFGPAWSDARLSEIGAALHRRADVRLGTSTQRAPAPIAVTSPPPPTPEFLPLAVVGAHLSGEPLNHQLTNRGARLVRSTMTAPCYRLYVLSNTEPAKPGLERVADGLGSSIEVEVWELPSAAWAEFVAQIPPPHGIGALQLADQTIVPGYQCESVALQGAKDITRFVGWRAFRQSSGEG